MQFWSKFLRNFHYYAFIYSPVDCSSDNGGDSVTVPPPDTFFIDAVYLKAVFKVVNLHIPWFCGTSKTGIKRMNKEKLTHLRYCLA